MHFLGSVIAGLIVVVGNTPAAANNVPMAPDPATVSESDVLTGDWEGPLGGGSIKFRFEKLNGSWQGWFVSKKDGSLFPLKGLEISKGTVTFTHTSKPPLSYHLMIDDNGKALSGTFSFPDGTAIEQTLTRG